MASLNKIILIGNLTRDPELRYIASGTALAKFGLAVNEKYKDKETVVFVDVTVWGKQAENCGEYLHKGSPVAIDGRLSFEQWEDKAGQRRSKLTVTAERVVFLGSKGNSTREREPGEDDNKRGYQHEPTDNALF